MLSHSYAAFPPLQPPPGEHNPPIGIPKPVPVFEEPSHLGKTILWIAFAVFATTTVVNGLHATRLNKRRRTFHFLVGIILTVTTLSYLALATNFGAFYVPESHRHLVAPKHPPLRAIYIGRFVEWFITLPLTGFTLGLLTGLPWLDIAFGVLSIVGFILSGLLSGFQSNAVGVWFFFIISVLFYLAVVHVFGIRGFKVSRIQSDDVRVLYGPLTTLVLLTWATYAVVFALGTKSKIISFDFELVLYAIIDLAAKAAFSLWLILQHSQIIDEYAAALLPDSWVDPSGISYNPISTNEEVKSLQNELKKRKLPVSGNKQALIHRLGANDHQISTSTTQFSKRVVSEEGKDVNAPPEVPPSTVEGETTAPGQPLTSESSLTKSKVENLGAFTFIIPQPARIVDTKKVKIPVLATNWAATADTISAQSSSDVPKLSTASDALEEAVLSGRLFANGLSINERANGDAESDSENEKTTTGEETEEVDVPEYRDGPRTGVKGVKEDARLQHEKDGQNAKDNEKAKSNNIRSKALVLNNPDDDDEEDEEDKRARESYRRARIRQIKMASNGGLRLFGHLRKVDANTYLTAIDDEEEDVFVVILIKDDSIEECIDVEYTFASLAQVYTSTKFLSGEATTLEFGLDENCVPDPDILPTVLVYKAGNLHCTLIRPDLEPKSIEQTLADEGVLQLVERASMDENDDLDDD
ncbi:family A G protein-coupled receptor-like protein [Wallemia mellicola]|nr:family A G protein-coupled receptor-like protein [Wallemia mellicola]TIC10372.1 family A G protein-coupled receptor-like protein [Wallemia mellicola]